MHSNYFIMIINFNVNFIIIIIVNVNFIIIVNVNFKPIQATKNSILPHLDDSYALNFELHA